MQSGTFFSKAYVADGLIDYEGMKQDHLFREYIRNLDSAEPDRLKTDAERLALMSNAYKRFCDQRSDNAQDQCSVMDYSKNEKGFFDVREHILAGKTLSLNELEHQLIRPTFKEPRVHVALVCAALSCPAIRPEAYVGDRLDQQLQDQSVLFANNPATSDSTRIPIKLDLSPILDWYGEDWGERYPDGGYLAWLAELAEDADLKAHVQSAIAGEIQRHFVPYDWNLNSQRKPGTKSGHSSGEFGSGSIQTE